jgi:hypothetical protein
MFNDALKLETLFKASSSEPVQRERNRRNVQSVELLHAMRFDLTSLLCCDLLRFSDFSGRRQSESTF